MVHVFVGLSSGNPTNGCIMCTDRYFDKLLRQSFRHICTVNLFRRPTVVCRPAFALSAAGDTVVPVSLRSNVAPVSLTSLDLADLTQPPPAFCCTLVRSRTAVTNVIVLILQRHCILAKCMQAVAAADCLVITVYHAVYL